MSDNKPILFINSAQTNSFKDQNQYVFDSRFDKKTVVVKRENEQKEALPKEVIPKEVKRIEKVKEEKVEEKMEEKIEIENQDPREASDKLMNKIQLLNKRANLGRYVLVNVVTEKGDFEGYFIEDLDDEVVLKFENDDEKAILKSAIKDIKILKV